MKSILIGLAVVVPGCALMAGLAWLGWYLWGDGGQVLMIAPLVILMVGALAYMVGEIIRGHP